MKLLKRVPKQRRNIELKAEAYLTEYYEIGKITLSFETIDEQVNDSFINNLKSILLLNIFDGDSEETVEEISYAFDAKWEARDGYTTLEVTIPFELRDKLEEENITLDVYKCSNCGEYDVVLDGMSDGDNISGCDCGMNFILIGMGYNTLKQAKKDGYEPYEWY